MSKYVHYIYALLFGGLLIATIISFHNNNVLESRLNTLNKLSPSANSEKTFKEDYYITQQSNDTTLILTCFGLGFALFSFFTYQSVVGSVADQVSRMKKNYKTHKDDYNVQHDRLLKLEIDFLKQVSDEYQEKACIHYNNGDSLGCIFAAINSCQLYCKLLDLLGDDKIYYDAIYISFLETVEKLCRAVEETEEDLTFGDFDESHYKNRLNFIINHLKGEEYYAFYTAMKKVKFEPLFPINDNQNPSV